MLRDFFFGRHLDDEENILLTVHKHWLLGLKALWLPTVLFIAIWSVLYFKSTKYIVYGVSLASLGAAVWWIRNFLDYYLDAWVITDKGVIDLEWHGWFHRSSSRVLYSDIQGVSYEINGIVPTLLHFGDISLEKISTGESISMPYVHQPRKVEAVILEAMEAYMLSKNLRDAETVQEILSEFVASTLQKQAAEKSASKLKKKPPVKQ